MGQLATQKIRALQTAIVGLDTHFENETIHHFSEGVYCREMRLVEDDLIVGKQHKYSCVNILSKGIVIVDDGIAHIRYEAPMTWVSPPGTKRAVLCLADCVWTTIHPNPTDTRDEDALERALIVDESYTDFVASTGMTEEEISIMISDISDQIPFPNEFYGVEVRTSDIHGVGLFATGSYAEESLVCPARIGDNRTPAGRYMNHSSTPNTMMVKVEGDIWVKSSRDISVGEELTTDYNENRRTVL